MDTVLDGRSTQLVFSDGKFALKKAA